MKTVRLGLSMTDAPGKAGRKASRELVSRCTQGPNSHPTAPRAGGTRNGSGTPTRPGRETKRAGGEGSLSLGEPWVPSLKSQMRRQDSRTR